MHDPDILESEAEHDQENSTAQIVSEFVQDIFSSLKADATTQRFTPATVLTTKPDLLNNFILII